MDALPGSGDYAFAAKELPPSVAADVLFSGEVTVRSEGRMQVQRNQGVEDVPPGTAVTIQAGEAVIYVRQPGGPDRAQHRRSLEPAHQLRGLLHRPSVDADDRPPRAPKIGSALA